MIPKNITIFSKLTLHIVIMIISFFAYHYNVHGLFFIFFLFYSFSLHSCHSIPSIESTFWQHFKRLKFLLNGAFDTRTLYMHCTNQKTTNSIFCCYSCSNIISQFSFHFQRIIYFEKHKSTKNRFYNPNKMTTNHTPHTVQKIFTQKYLRKMNAQHQIGGASDTD